MKKKKTTLPPHYNNIDDLPIMIWEKVHKTKDLTLLLIKPRKLIKAEKILLAKVWTEIYDEYIKVFGFGESLKAILKKRIEIYKLQAQYLVSRENSTLNFIKRKNAELDKLKQEQLQGAGDIFTAKIWMEQILKYHLPMKDLSVREFYAYMNNVKKMK